jgi:hypothetical protein
MINAPRVGTNCERIAEAGRLRFAESEPSRKAGGRVLSGGTWPPIFHLDAMVNEIG